MESVSIPPNTWGNKIMLDKKKTYNENKVATIIGTGTSITGEIKSKGTVRIEGHVSGNVQCEDTIVVHETGRVKADLIGGQVIVSGEVHGNISAHDRLEVTSTGKILGDITAPRIAIAEGVMFEGKCTMKAPGSERLSLPNQQNVTPQIKAATA